MPASNLTDHFYGFVISSSLLFSPHQYHLPVTHSLFVLQREHTFSLMLAEFAMMEKPPGLGISCYLASTAEARSRGNTLFPVSLLVIVHCSFRSDIGPWSTCSAGGSASLERLTIIRNEGARLPGMARYYWRLLHACGGL
jgi:hypothetical protein